MAWYPYSYKTAFDPATMNLAPVGSLGQVYAIGDTGFSTPLTTYDLSGLPVDLAVQNDAGYIPSFQVEDQTSVIWKSGEYVLELVTSMPLPGPTGAKIVNATDNGDGTMTFELSDGSTVGPIPIPEGPVVVDDDVAANINDLGSQTRAALNATFATNEYVGTLAYGTNLEATDATVGTWIGDVATITGQNLENEIQAAVGPKLDKVEAAATYAGRVDDSGYETLQAAVDATPAGGMLEIWRQWTIGTPVNLANPIGVTCARTGLVTTTGTSTHAFNVLADDVVLDGVNAVGTGGTVAGTAAAVNAVGTEAAPIRGLKVKNSSLRGFSKYAVNCVSVKDFRITGNQIDDIAYGGVMLLACADGAVGFNAIRNIIQPSGFVNSYGIAMSRNSSMTMTDSPRSSNIMCAFNLIDGVPLWEGIDTHAGENLTITNNLVYNTSIGIALVPGVDAAGVDRYAAQGIVVTGNTIDSKRYDGSAKAGIQVVGATTSIDVVEEYARGIISNNTIQNHGMDNSSAQAGVVVQATEGMIVSGNRIINPALSGIIMSHNNKSAIVSDNTIVDAWTNRAAFTAAIYFQSLHQTVTLKGNKAIASGKVATLKNDRGLYLSSALNYPDVSIKYSDNDFAACATPVIDSPTLQNITETTLDARKISLYTGVPPVPRAEAIDSPAADVAALKTAVDEIRVALKAIGIIA